MENAFKEIVLLQGLHPLNDYHFRMIKTLLANDMKLRGNYYEEYDKIQFAKLMAEKFKSDAGLGKLITLFKKIPDLEAMAETLKKEKANVLAKMKRKGKGKNAAKSSKQGETSTVQNTFTSDKDYKPESVMDVSLSKKKKNSTKKTDDLGRNTVRQKKSSFGETFTATTGLQRPQEPPPSSSTSSSAKKKKTIITKTDDPIKILEIEQSPASIPPTESCPQTLSKPSVTLLSSHHTLQMSPIPPKSLQSPRIHSTTPSTSGESPQLLLESSSASLQTSQIHPATQLSSQSTPQRPPKTSSKSRQTSQIPSPSPSCNLQFPEKFAKPPSTVQIFWLCPITLSSNVPQVSVATCSSPETPQKPPKQPTNSQIPQILPVTPGIPQTPQTPLATFGSLQALQMPLASSSNLQTPQIFPETSASCPLSMKPKLKCVPSEPAEESGLQLDPKEVMVLKVTEPFKYQKGETEQTMMHATVATENAFFRVKVFDMKVKDKFTPNNVIAISNYVGRDGFLEIYNSSGVSNVSADRKMNISTTLIKRAKATPKISELCSQSEGKYVNGIFLVCKKMVRPEFIFYEIQDRTGKMGVVVFGRLASVYCEEGDKLKLTCFQVALSEDGWLLISVLHSHLKVIKARKNEILPLTPDSNMET